VSNVRFMQDLFRESRRQAASSERHWISSRAGRGRVFAKPSHRCGGGKNLASPQRWLDQRAMSDEWLDWYAIYPQIWKRLHARNPRGVLHLFGGGGGSSEGDKRAGGSCGHNIDIEDQADYV